MGFVGKCSATRVLCCVLISSIVALSYAPTTVYGKDQDDPNWRVGQWGHFGRSQPPSSHMASSMSSWAHRAMRDIDDDDYATGDNDSEEPESIKGAVQNEKKLRVARLAEPSPLTDSGVPPVVVHIPMRDAERAEYGRLLKAEETRRYQSRGDGGSSTTGMDEEDSTTFENIPMSQHPLPRQYSQRVRQAAAESGFEWMGLAVPNLFPDRHLFHAKVDHVERALMEHHQKQGRSGEEILRGNMMPPPRYDENRVGSNDRTTSGIVERTHGVSEQFGIMNRDRPGHRKSEPDERREAEDQDKQPSFAQLMAERNKRQMRRREWKAKWEEWRDQHTDGAGSRSESRHERYERHHKGVRGEGAAKHSAPHPKSLDHREARRALGESLEEALARNTHIAEVLPQKPQARVLRMGRVRSMWQDYRAPHDLDDQSDARPARGFTTGPAVSDPMLTEQWSMYDAELWGDVPEGPTVHRPSISGGPQVWEGLGIEGAGVAIGVVDSGIELAHPELVHRYARAISFDALNPHRNRPPTPVDSWQEIHGTAAAGVALAERGNGVCGAGVAPKASLGAIRLLGTRSPTDSEEASAVSHACRPHGSDPAHNQLINAIYSNSWGPVDDGSGLRGPGRITAEAMEACVHQYGRHGKGAIYVWAGGNGRSAGDNTNFDGYANRPETIAVGAIDDTGSQAWYSEPGACLMLVAPSSGGSSGVVTSDPSGPMGYSVGRCTRIFGGTSAAAPAVAGIVALMLQVAPELGWRDVQHVLVRSCDRISDRDKREPWSRNDAGLWHSHGYGFGLINATRAVLVASGWSALSPRNAMVATSPVLSGSNSLHQDVVGRSPNMEGASPIDLYDDDGDGPDPSDDVELGDSDRPVISRTPVDTAGVYPRFSKVYDADSGIDEPLTDVEEETVSKKRAARTEGVLKSMLLIGPRYLWHKGKQIHDAVADMAQSEREARRYARRERAPNRVRIDGGERDGVSVMIPPGHTAEFRWHWPAPTGEANDPYGIRSIEHVGVRLDMRTPAGRGMIRIWLCAPSGTCSLMAPAPHGQDRHDGISGRDWTYWSVRNWGEAPIYGEDRSGHGRGTWGLMLTHTESPDRHSRHKIRTDRRYHPSRVDARLNWWQLEVRGTHDPAPAIYPFTS